MRITAMRRIAGALLVAALAAGPAGAQDAPKDGAQDSAKDSARDGAPRAQGAPIVVSPPSGIAVKEAEPGDPSLSPECRVPGSQLYTLAKLKAVKAALLEKRPVRVLAIGGNAAPGASATYPVKLETALERSMPNVDVVMEYRGLQGEIASGAAERLRSMVADVEPDLVIWQVGTHDALARVELDAFTDALTETVKWIKSHDIDVVLVDPLYTASLASDAYYTSIVQSVRTVATKEAVPLVLRYDAMRYLAGRSDKGESHMLGQQFRLNDLGLRCMAEHVTRAITLSLLQPDAAGTAIAPSGATGTAGATAAPDKP